MDVRSRTGGRRGKKGSGVGTGTSLWGWGGVSVGLRSRRTPRSRDGWVEGFLWCAYVYVSVSTCVRLCVPVCKCVYECVYVCECVYVRTREYGSSPVGGPSSGDLTSRGGPRPRVPAWGRGPGPSQRSKGAADDKEWVGGRGVDLSFNVLGDPRRLRRLLMSVVSPLTRGCRVRVWRRMGCV